MKHVRSLLLITLFIPFYSFSQHVFPNKPFDLEGALNFRDIGGYATSDGKNVITGKIFRAADISKLTDNDMRILSDNHIYTVIDFRGTKEAALAPDRHLPGTDYTLCPAGSDPIPDMKDMVNQLRETDFLLTMYSSPSVSYYGDRYKPLFNKLLSLPDQEAGLLFHCTGGRDRTGMATALILYVLDVPMETIEVDFTASNDYLRKMDKSMYLPMAEQTGMSIEEIDKKLELRPELIRSFFQTLADSYGSVERFFEQELGVGETEKNLLKEKFTR